MSIVVRRQLEPQQRRHDNQRGLSKLPVRKRPNLRIVARYISIRSLHAVVAPRSFRDVKKGLA